MGEEDRELILEPEASAELEQATADYEEARPGLGREFLEAGKAR